MRRFARPLGALVLLAAAAFSPAQERLTTADYFKLRSAGAVQWSPDGTRLAHTINNHDGAGKPYSQLWLLDVGSGQTTRVGDERSRGSQPRWAPDGKSLAYIGTVGGKSG